MKDKEEKSEKKRMKDRKYGLVMIKVACREKECIWRKTDMDGVIVRKKERETDFK